MLQRIILKNFVHFKNEQELKFPPKSPILFVGASSSGKTAVLELIRRCLDSKINSSLTTRANPSLSAYVFCEFSIDTTNLKDYDSKVISGMLVECKQAICKDGRDKENIQEITKNDGTSSDDDEEEDDGPRIRYDERCDQMFHKIIIYKYKKRRRIRSKTYLEKKDGEIADFQQNIKLPGTFLDLGNYEEFVRNVLKHIRTNQNEGNIYFKKPKLWNTISSSFVGVLSMRGMGTFQWTKSEKIAQDYKEENYQNTCKHAEIITDLMGNEVIDEIKEKRIFKYLTDEESIEFTKTSNVGNTDSITITRGGKTFPLLKTSVGIIEAKQFSLLMAHKELKTICYEEPDRGMHPQMIQRMKEVLHRESQERKTIIVVTHSPMLVDSMWLENTFIFCKEKEMYFIERFDKVIPDNNAKLSEIEEMKTLLFSTKVLLVEGKSDKVVLQGIFRHCFIKLASEGNGGDRDKKIISYQILPCGGASFTKPVKKFCKKINVKCLILLDRDQFGLVEDKFFWEEGDLEDVLLCDEDNREKICSTLCIKNYKDILSKINKEEEDNGLPITKTQLKQDIKKTLSHGLTKTQSEELTKIIIDYKDVRRLLDFLRDS